MNNTINEKAIQDLNGLLQRNKDAAEGFVEVANNINYINLTQWLIDWSKRHRHYADELAVMIEKMGGEANESTTLLGELHHAWVDLKAQWTNNDTEALMEECYRGEEKIWNDYSEVVGVYALPDYAKSILNRQRNEIKRALQDIEALKISYKNAEQAEVSST
ncbi:MAG: PA2169 family four-helix-bundle protein [Bacteroidota bacterium]